MNTRPLSREQSGAVLLAFMLILITGTSYLLLNRLNNYSTYARDTETQIALLEAKKSLLSYAMNYPELRNNPEKGPGFLPCPAQNETGDPASGCAVSTGTSLGRLPYKILGLSDLRESGSELLWYAVSDNFKNTLPNSTVLNSETPGLISVDGVNDIVAVIIAPGPPVAAQNSRPSINKSDYLEGINADSDASTFVTSSTGEFNDRLITITRQELMAVVEQRVINEIRAVLANYYNDYGAYPWLAAFADPKADSRRLAGTHNGSNNSSNLIDSTADFTDWDLQNGDLVINITDGSMTAVSSVTNSSTLALNSLSFGAENDFDAGDKYTVFKQNWVINLLSGTAEAGSTGLTLIDTSKDFEELGISTGDIIDVLIPGNVDSSGMVDTVDSSTQLTVKSLNGGITTQFTSGVDYIIRSNIGRVTAGVGNLLTDTNKNFVVMGIQVGDLIENLSDYSIGTISSVTANTLTVKSLQFGTDNAFDFEDYYYLPRYNTDNNTRKGLLSFHEEGELFPTAYDLEFNIAAAGSDIVFDTVSFPAYQAGYKAEMEYYVSNYVNANSISLTLEEGRCNWIVPEIADCITEFDDFVSISGNDTASVNSQTQITDSNALFVTDNVKRGDLAHNFDDETYVSSGNADALTSGTATGGSSNLILEDTGNNFVALGISAGDDIKNTTDGSSGVVEFVTTDKITVESLAGGTDNVFEEFDNYEIWRHWELYDASATFISNGIEPYNYVIQNITLEVELSQPKIQGIISDVIDENTLEIENYTGEGDTPTPTTLIFRPGDQYEIFAPIKDMVVRTNPTINTTVSISKLTAANPDFDAGEYYRIIPAASSTSGTVDSTSPVSCTASSVCTITDSDADFITRGIEVGDTIENTSDDFPNSSFGIITNVTSTTITTILYGGVVNLFLPTHNYTIYHDYVHSRHHEIHARFSGNMKPKSLSSVTGVATGGSNNLLLEDTTKDFINLGVLIGDTVTNTTDGSSGIIESRTNTKITVASLINGTNNVFTMNDNYIIAGSNKRLRDVCMNYNANCYAASATALTGYGNIPLIDIEDFQSDGSTKVGQISFTPTFASIGSIRLSNMDYYLAVSGDDIPGWFVKNKWHQLIYVAYSADYVPGGANDCETPVNNCLTLQVQRPYGTEVKNTLKALVMVASKELEDNVTCVVSGNVTKSGGGTLLVNSDAAFKKDSIIPGDTVLNLIDGSTAQVVSVDSDTEITTFALVGGTSNSWNLSNVYQFSKTEKQDRAMAKLSSYYEFENCNRGNDEFDKSNITDSFNDQIIVIDP